MQTSIYSVIRFNSWIENFGCQKAGLPANALNALHQSSLTFQERAMMLRNNILDVQKLWRLFLAIDKEPAALQALDEKVKQQLEKLALELYNLKLSTAATISDTSKIKVQVIEANALVDSYIQKDTHALAEIDQNLASAQQHVQLAQARLKNANSELSGSKGFWNGFLTGLTFGLYNRIQEKIDEANAALAKCESELNKQHNLKNQQVKIINERGEAIGLLSSLVNIGDVLTNLQNALNTLLITLTEAYNNQEKHITTSGRVGQYYAKALSNNMDHLFALTNAFFSDQRALGVIGPVDATTMVTPLDVITMVTGSYECHKYDKGGKNDWHYITITRLSDDSVIWRNKAGVNWILNRTVHSDKLCTGNDCPYYDSQKEATVQWNNNVVTGILGPGNELYEKIS